jgi:hypothetical protein
MGLDNTEQIIIIIIIIIIMLYLGVKQPGRGADHPPPPSALRGLL